MKNVAFLLGIIKSKKILKYILNHLEYHNKLIFMNYNKVLQHKFELTIDDYKKESKRIKIGGLNGLGKEYTPDGHELIFEGKYLNGKRNGKGIEYFKNGKKKYEGVFLNGNIYEGIQYDENRKKIITFKNGKGIELYNNGLIKFEGEYLKGKKWTGKGYTYYGIKLFEIKNGNGYIREYNSDGSLLFKGHYLNGERNGKGKEYSHGKLLFEGNYLNGVRNGKGKEFSDNFRIKFEGEYLNGERWNGKVYDSNGKKDYELKDGEKKENQFNFINSIDDDIFLINDVYTLFFKNFPHCFELYNKNSFDSDKIYFYPEGISLHSIFITDYKRGKEYKNGKLVYKGEYVNGKKDGKGKEYYEDELIFEGEYIKGERNGKGKQYFFDELIFEGEYMDGVRNGFGKEYYINNKIKFEGEYQDGKINGKGKEYDYFGRLIFEGEYVNNKRMNGLVYKYKNNDFSKYIYLIPQKFISKYENKVPINIMHNYYDKYHIKSSSIKHIKNNLNNFRNNRIIIDKRKINRKRNKWCRWTLNNWR